MENKREIKIPWDEIYDAASGIDKAGNPMSTASLNIDDISSVDKAVPVMNIVLNSGIYTIHSSGGCVIVTIDFLKKDINDYSSAKNICDMWIKNLDDKKFDGQILTLTLMPYVFHGEFFIVYNNLVFADGYENSKFCRLILAFDNLATVPVATEEIDFRSIFTEAEMEVKKEEDALQKEIDGYNEELKSMDVNPFDKEISEEFSSFYSQNENVEGDDEKSTEDRWKRISEE